MAMPTQKQQTEFLELLSEGKAFYDAANDVGIDKGVFYRMCGSDPQFDEQVTRARAIGQEASVDEMRELADTADETNYNAVKLKIWERQWTASKRAPRKYGDKIQAELSGKDGGPIQTTQIVVHRGKAPKPLKWSDVQNEKPQ